MTRISNQWVVNSFLRVLNRNHSDLSKLQVQVSSGKQIQTASDNPVNNALSMQFKTEVYEHNQYSKNISRVTEWLDNTDGVMTSLESALQRARELAVQGANDTLVQSDRDAIAMEIDQILQHVIDIANTDVGGEYLFAGADTRTKPISTQDGQTPYSMTDIVTYAMGEARDAMNLANILGVDYNGDARKLLTEIEKGVLLSKNVTGSEVFFRGDPIVPQPLFAERAPPLTQLTRLETFNKGEGVQAGSIVLTDSNGIDHWIDLKDARRIDEMLFAINTTNSFEASIDEVPTDTAVGLGIAQNVGQANRMTGQPILFLNNSAQDFDPNVATLDQLGVESGFLSINTRDGQNRRVTVQSTMTLQQLINDINAVDGGLTLKAEFEPVLNRLILTDQTFGTSSFSVESMRSELKIRDLPAHTAADLGLFTSDSGSDGVLDNTIVSRFTIPTAAAALSTIGPDLGNTFSGFMGIFQNVGLNNTLTSPAHPTVTDSTDTLASLNSGTGVLGGAIMMTGRDGFKSYVNLNGAVTIDDVISRINAQTGGRQTASWDNINKQFNILDNTVGGTNFTVEPAVGPENYPLSAINGGKGVEKGFIRIVSGDGTTSTVDLTTAQNLGDVINAINVGAPHVSASYDSVSQRLVLVDLQPGAGEFHIEEVDGNQNVAVREATTTARYLGILGADSGKQLFGSSLTAPNIAIDGTATLLTDLLPKPPEAGKITLKNAAGTATEVDLTGAQTIQDVIDSINATGSFTAIWDPSPQNRFIITDISGATGDKGIAAEEQTNTARDLGFISGTSLYRADQTNANPKDVIVSAPIQMQSLATLIGGVDLDPAIELNTPLSSLNAGRPFNPGVQLGRIRINDKAYRPDQPGHSAVIDLRGATTIKDVLDRINDPANGLYVEARINAERNGIEIIDKNNGATGKLSIVDIDSTTAIDLGFGGKNSVTVGNTLSGGDLDPRATESTLVSSLRVNDGGIKLGKVYVQSGEFSGEIDLSSAKTLGDVITIFNEADPRANLSGWIDPDGRRLNLTNTKGQAYIKVRDLGDKGENAASGLGLGGSKSIFETLQDLRDSLLRGDSTAISEQSIRLISEDLERVLLKHAEVGVKTNRAEASLERQENLKLNINKMLDVVENIDMSEAIMRMSQLETAFQAALQTGARVLQTTLMDFLR
jgi:flagellin-like hook-associated protein FlgL